MAGFLKTEENRRLAVSAGSAAVVYILLFLFFGRFGCVSEFNTGFASGCARRRCQSEQRFFRQTVGFNAVGFNAVGCCFSGTSGANGS